MLEGVVLILIAVGLFGGAAWFAMVCIEPRIERAIERGEEQEPGDGRS